MTLSKQLNGIFLADDFGRLTILGLHFLIINVCKWFVLVAKMMDLGVTNALVSKVLSLVCSGELNFGFTRLMLQ